MTIKKIFVFAIFAFTNCNNSGQHSPFKSTDISKVSEKVVTKNNKESFEKTEIICDTVFKNKGYKLTLTVFDSSDADEIIPNTQPTERNVINKTKKALLLDIKRKRYL